MEFNFSEIKDYKGLPSQKFFDNYPYTGHHYTVETVKKVAGKPDVVTTKTVEVRRLDLPAGTVAPANLKQGKGTVFLRGNEIGFRPFYTPHAKIGCKAVRITYFLNGDRKKSHYFDLKGWFAFLGKGKYDICPSPPFENPRTKQNRANSIKAAAGKFAGTDEFSKGAKWQQEVG